MANDWSVSLRVTREGYLHHPYPYDLPMETLNAETTLAAYEQAIQLAPREAVLYYHKARALEELGRATEAQQTYREAQRLGYSTDLPGK
jgi:tetratricopeptide (TPR) repeat protein